MKILNKYTGAVIYEDDKPDLGQSIIAATEKNANLCGADLYEANLCEANLCEANLCNCSGAPLRINGSRFTLTFAAPDSIQVGCERRTIKDWLAKYQAIGEKHKFSAEEIAEYKLYLDLFAARYLKKEE